MLQLRLGPVLTGSSRMDRSALRDESRRAEILPYSVDLQERDRTLNSCVDIQSVLPIIRVHVQSIMDHLCTVLASPALDFHK